MKNFLWRNGELIEAGDAGLSPALGALHYGTGAFEGILCVKDRLFRLDDHLDRLAASAQTLGLRIPYGHAALHAAIGTLLKANGCGSCYLRPVAFSGAEYLKPAKTGGRAELVILCRPFIAPLHAWGMRKSVTLTVARDLRQHWSGALARAKLTGKYLAGMLAAAQAREKGFDEALLLDEQGLVAEATSANIFMVKDGIVTTPPADHCLRGITRDSLLRIAENLGHGTRQAHVTVEELMEADEIFLSGTARGIVPVKAVDDRTLRPGPVTAALRRGYVAAINGSGPFAGEWLTACP